MNEANTTREPAAISSYLYPGAENAVTARELCDLLKLRPRDISAAVERERRAGKPICASTGSNPGYFLAATQEEMRRYCVSLNKRAGEIQKTRRACLKTLEKLQAAELPPIPDLPEPPELPAADLPEPAELPEPADLPPIPELPTQAIPVQDTGRSGCKANKKHKTHKGGAAK